MAVFKHGGKGMKLNWRGSYRIYVWVAGIYDEADSDLT